MRNVLVIAVIATLAAPIVLAVPTGPYYPPEGGVTLTPSGHLGRAGGLTWSYADIDMDLFNGLWWGPWAGDALGFAFDGAIDEPGETLVFDFDSDLAGGQARWLGSTDLRHIVGGNLIEETVATRLTLQAQLPDNTPIAFVDPTTVGLDGDLGAVIAVPGDYAMNVLVEAQHNNVWTPAYDLYDALHNDPNCEGCVRVSVGFGFYQDLNLPPVANFSWSPDPAIERQEVTFTSSSSDPENRTLLQEWDLDNDGAFDDALGPSANRSFEEPGNYTVALRVTDDRGLVDTVAYDVVVADCSQGPVSDVLRNTVHPAAPPVQNTTYFLACDLAAGELGV